MKAERFTIRQGKVRGQGTCKTNRFDLYRDGKIVYSTHSGGRIIPRKLASWARALNKEKPHPN